LDLLTGGSQDMPERHQTLRAALESSYELLAPAEQRLLARLGVFVGGCTLAAAEAVCNVEGLAPVAVLDGLYALVNHNLLRQMPGQAGEPRWGMLAMIQEYALEQLEASGEAEALQRARAAYYLALAEEAEPQLKGAQQAGWLERLEQEHDNLRAALRWAEAQDAAETGLRLAGALGPFWAKRGYLSEGRARLAVALARADEAGGTAAHAKTLHAAAILASDHSDYASAQAFLEESLAIRRELGDQRGVAASLNNLGRVAQEQCDYASARSRFVESLSGLRELGDMQAISLVLGNLGWVAAAQGDYASARSLYGESLALARELNHPRRIASALHKLGCLAYDQQDYASARSLCEESLAIMRQLGDKQYVADILQDLGSVVVAQGDYPLAYVLYRESLTLLRQLGDKWTTAFLLEGFATLATAQGVFRRGARLWGAAEALREAIHSPLPSSERARYEQKVAAARAHLGEAAFAAAWAEGRAMDLEEAMDYAVQEGGSE
ncbi:MAG: ATP-binding protein, partial [Ardenticatenaceae bacterium]